MKPKPEQKICPVCKRPFDNRKRWASRQAWEAVVYCSKRCRAARGKAAA